MIKTTSRVESDKKFKTPELEWKCIMDPEFERKKRGNLVIHNSTRL